MLGAAKARVATVAVNWRLAPPEIEYVLADSGARMVFVVLPTARSEVQGRDPPDERQPAKEAVAEARFRSKTTPLWREA